MSPMFGTLIFLSLLFVHEGLYILQRPSSFIKLLEKRTDTTDVIPTQHVSTSMRNPTFLGKKTGTTGFVDKISATNVFAFSREALEDSDLELQTTKTVVSTPLANVTMLNFTMSEMKLEWKKYCRVNKIPLKSPIDLSKLLISLYGPDYVLNILTPPLVEFESIEPKTIHNGSKPCCFEDGPSDDETILSAKDLRRLWRDASFTVLGQSAGEFNISQSLLLVNDEDDNALLQFSSSDFTEHNETRLQETVISEAVSKLSTLHLAHRQ